MKLTSNILTVAIAASMLVAPAVYAVDTKNQGYLVDRYGNIITSARTGDCFRSREWSSSRESGKCKLSSAQKTGSPK